MIQKGYNGQWDYKIQGFWRKSPQSSTLILQKKIQIDLNKSLSMRKIFHCMKLNYSLAFMFQIDFCKKTFLFKI